MAFDRENLRPLYRLEMGKTGDSCALYIAKRLGMPEDMIRTAASEAYGDGGELEKPLEKTREKTLYKTREKPQERSQEKPLEKSPGRQWPGGWSGFWFPALSP